jgi:hypothetical protein
VEDGRPMPQHSHSNPSTLGSEPGGSLFSALNSVGGVSEGLNGRSNFMRKDVLGSRGSVSECSGNSTIVKGAGAGAGAGAGGRSAAIRSGVGFDLSVHGGARGLDTSTTRGSRGMDVSTRMGAGGGDNTLPGDTSMTSGGNSGFGFMSQQNNQPSPSTTTVCMGTSRGSASGFGFMAQSNGGSVDGGFDHPFEGVAGQTRSSSSGSGFGFMGQHSGNSSNIRGFGSGMGGGGSGRSHQRSTQGWNGNGGSGSESAGVGKGSGFGFM